MTKHWVEAVGILARKDRLTIMGLITNLLSHQLFCNSVWVKNLHTGYIFEILCLLCVFLVAHLIQFCIFILYLRQILMAVVAIGQLLVWEERRSCDKTTVYTLYIQLYIHCIYNCIHSTV